MSALVLFFSGPAIHPRNQTISEKLEPWIKVLCCSQNSVFSNLCYSQNTPNERRSYALVRHHPLSYITRTNSRRQNKTYQTLEFEPHTHEVVLRTHVVSL